MINIMEYIALFDEDLERETEDIGLTSYYLHEGLIPLMAFYDYVEEGLIYVN